MFSIGGCHPDRANMGGIFNTTSNYKEGGSADKFESLPKWIVSMSLPIKRTWKGYLEKDTPRVSMTLRAWGS